MHSRHSMCFRFLYVAGDNYKKPAVLLIFFEELGLRKKKLPSFFTDLQLVNFISQKVSRFEGELIALKVFVAEHYI